MNTMIDTIKSYFLQLHQRQEPVEAMLKLCGLGHLFYTCLYVRGHYSGPQYLWYRRQLDKYAKKHKVEYTSFPFQELAQKNNTTALQERIKFLENLKAQVS